MYEKRESDLEHRLLMPRESRIIIPHKESK